MSGGREYERAGGRQLGVGSMLPGCLRQLLCSAGAAARISVLCGGTPPRVDDVELVTAQVGWY